MRTAPRAATVLATLAAVSLTSCSLFSLDPGDDASDGDLSGSIRSGGILRTYQVHLPPDRVGQRLPVVILLHGSPSNGSEIRALTGFGVVADEFGFIAVYPDATSDWAEGCGCTSSERDGVDDVQFISDLIDELRVEFDIELDRVYVAGFSQGAFMAQKLACDLGDRLAAVATVAATMSLPLSETCMPARSIPTVMTHGTADQVFPWEGDLGLGAESVLSADGALRFWGDVNGCGMRRASRLVARDLAAGVEIWSEGFDACAEGETILYRIEGGGHIWPDASAFSASWEIGRFFDEH